MDFTAFINLRTLRVLQILQISYSLRILNKIINKIKNKCRKSESAKKLQS